MESYSAIVSVVWPPKIDLHPTWQTTFTPSQSLAKLQNITTSTQSPKSHLNLVSSKFLILVIEIRCEWGCGHSPSYRNRHNSYLSENLWNPRKKLCAIRLNEITDMGTRCRHSCTRGKWKEKKESPVLNNFIKRANAFHFGELWFISFLF